MRALVQKYEMYEQQRKNVKIKSVLTGVGEHYFRCHSVMSLSGIVGNVGSQVLKRKKKSQECKLAVMNPVVSSECDAKPVDCFFKSDAYINAKRNVFSFPCHLCFAHTTFNHNWIQSLRGAKHYLQVEHASTKNERMLLERFALC